MTCLSSPLTFLAGPLRIRFHPLPGEQESPIPVYNSVLWIPTGNLYICINREESVNVY